MAEKLLKLIIYYSEVDYMVNIQNSVALLCKNKQKIEIKNMLYISTLQMKCIGINLGKYKIYVEENYKTMVNKIEYTQMGRDSKFMGIKIQYCKDICSSHDF